MNSPNSEKEKIKALTKALQERIDSGIANDFNPNMYLNWLNTRNQNTTNN
ncbi:hypothetical protein [Wenyingzhuangia sp. IMCC45574]